MTILWCLGDFTLLFEICHCKQASGFVCQTLLKKILHINTDVFQKFFLRSSYTFSFL